jgi:hypothetical protein
MDEISNEGEKQAIKKAILDYFHEGHVVSDGKLYEEVLHPEWMFTRMKEGELQIVDRDEYVSWYIPEKFDPELEWETEFYSIDVTGDVASIKLRSECQKVGYIDYFNMMKIDGRWWVMHKISSHMKKNWA